MLFFVIVIINTFAAPIGKVFTNQTDMDIDNIKRT